MYSDLVSQQIIARNLKRYPKLRNPTVCFNDKIKRNMEINFIFVCSNEMVWVQK